MNGPLKMYLTKPVVRHDLPVELPNCMYRMKNIHALRNGTVITDTGHVSTTKENLDTFDQKNQAMLEMTTLVARQEQILLQLSDLKKQMLSLKENLRSGSSVSSQRTSVTVSIVKFNISDIVINVSPLYPPYFLEVLQKIWEGRIYLIIESYLHSTVSALSEQAKEFVSRLQIPTFKHGDLPQLTIRIIWKDVGPHAELVVSKVPIVGEVNILRYLARVTSCIPYEANDPFELDSLLDVCYILMQSKTKTNRSSAIHVINKNLGKSSWLCGRNEFTIADIAAFSSLKQIPSNEINANLNKWLQRCQTTFC